MTDNRLIITGTSAFFRLGTQRRTGQVYFSPDMLIREYNRFASDHDGRMLLPITRSHKPTFFTEPDNQHVILWSSRTGKALVAAIDFVEEKYDPEYPPHVRGYDMPDPWNQLPARLCLGVSEVQVMDFDPTDYQTEPVTSVGKIAPLDEALKARNVSLLRIIPKPNVEVISDTDEALN
ncbi:hypothetical protein [Bifidobacterium callitrichidarum]|uniref:Uncharacterized protein n=1 Tax=Bifidobacterium callitrichidarum TaxID=2052941 RepID=A0A2U2N0S4_9BIFI|nr:hypothetical protein [Bifidobacterium callitrichidarum]PWG62653.1 hypothetical protein DF196_11890 [Bifidobacterium callitrichidarum]